MQEKNEPLVVAKSFKVEKPSLLDNTADWDRLVRYLSKEGFSPINLFQLDPGSLRTLANGVRKANFDGKVILGCKKDVWEIMEIVDDVFSKKYLLGGAFDLGSTRIAFYLMDLKKGDTIYTTSVDNPQIPYGEDILSRIVYASTEAKVKELQGLVIGAFNQVIKEAVDAVGATPEDIYALTVAGNTTMSHFFMGLDPTNICREPYIPSVNKFPIFEAKDLGLNIHKRGMVYLFPNVGSYFGGDVVAGILASGMHQSEEISLLVDVGTNAEVVLGNRDWLIACAGAAGPALEGGVVERGMMAVPGAIDRVRINSDTLELTYNTIGGEKPKGLCGSGLIDLLAEMFQAGLLTIQGKINTKIKIPRVVENQDGVSFIVAFADETYDGKAIQISDIDISVLLKSKAAMYTILNIIARKVGLDVKDISKFYVAGSFGNHIDPKRAIQIGMLPDLPLEKFVPLGNTSGLGASMLLKDRSLFKDIDEICSKIAYMELNVNVELMHEFRGALFLPHTNPELFPSVKIPDEARTT